MSVTGLDSADAKVQRSRLTLHDSWHRGFHSKLARRFVAATVLCSSIVALVMTAVQLYLDYQRDLSTLDQSVRRIERALVPGLSESVWLLDETLIRRQLDGMALIDGIEYARVVDADGVLASVGTDEGRLSYWHQISLTHLSGTEQIALGRLEVRVSYSNAINRTLQRATLVFATNAMKMLLVAGCILIIYHVLIGRHLTRMAAFASAYDPETPPVEFSLNRSTPSADDARRADGGEKQSDTTDELGLLEAAMNRWMTTNHDYLTKLRDANREQAEFTYALSHDLKSPTNTMGMLIGELEEYGDHDEDNHVMLHDMKMTNRRMKKLIDDVLNYSRIVEERRKFEPVNIDRLVEEICTDLAADIAQAKATIACSTSTVLFGHPMQMRALFQNLVANAVKFRHPDRPPRIEITSVETPDRLTITVADNGIGIEKEHHEKVFGLFQRLHVHSTYEGSGLGLTICKRIVANHDGTIALGPGIDGGTAITMSFRVGSNDQQN